MNKRDIFLGFPSYLGSYPPSPLPRLCYFFAFTSAPLRLLFRFLFLLPFLFYPFYSPSIPFNPFPFSLVCFHVVRVGAIIHGIVAVRERIGCAAKKR
ncbi:hypothetical protein F5H01DRAFT_155084 [Linnemannia elongata]|nr:hypothetical protein F5H01DRAFT_155084 [Linnemannia elongata]